MTGAYQRNGKRWGDSGQERIAGKTAGKQTINYGGWNMKLSIEEKKILYAFGCGSHENTVRRLKWVTALTVDEKVKRRVLCLAKAHLHGVPLRVD